MTAKDVLYTDRARDKLRSGVDALANVVKVTLGPRGRNVLLEASYGAPTITKDGVTVAQVVELDDHFENLGAQLVKDVASKTNDGAGDGTTTATLLAQALYREGARLVAAGHHPMALKRGIDKAVERVVSSLKAMAQPVEGRRHIAQIATISANGDEGIGDKVGEAMERIGPDGVITVEEGKTAETELEVVEGMQLDRGYLSPYFVTDPERMRAVLDDPYVLVSERKISSMPDLIPLLELIAAAKRPLVIVADDIDGDALSTLVVNHLRGSLKCVAIKAPSFGDRRKDVLRDLAIVTGAQSISEELGLNLQDVTLEQLGSARRVLVDKDTTTLIQGAGDRGKLTERKAMMRAELARGRSAADEQELRKRLAKLDSGVAVLKVGAHTELELKERKARVEDAVRATQAAQQEGVVPGGGVALLRAQASLDELQVLEDEEAGVRIVRRTLEEPLRQLAENGAVDGAVVVERVRRGTLDFGYNAASEEYGSLLTMGVIDPVRVVRLALQNAASVAGLLLTTACAIAAHD
jgi:chaperonin GroEL